MKEKLKKYLEDNFKTKQELQQLGERLKLVSDAIETFLIPDSNHDVDVHTAIKSTVNLLTSALFPVSQTKAPEFQKPKNIAEAIHDLNVYNRMADKEAYKPLRDNAIEYFDSEFQAAGLPTANETLKNVLRQTLLVMGAAQSLKQPKNFLSGLATPEELKSQHDEALSRIQRIKDEKKAKESGTPKQVKIDISQPISQLKKYNKHLNKTIELQSRIPACLMGTGMNYHTYERAENEILTRKRLQNVVDELAKDQEERDIQIKCLEETAIESKRIIEEFNTTDGPTLNVVKKLAEMQNQTATILQKHIGNGNI